MKLKDIAMLLLLFILMIFGVNWVLKIADEAWENRAKAAGYYDTLPDSLKNPKDVKK